MPTPIDSRLLCFQMCSSAVMAMHSSSGIPWVPDTQPTFYRQYTTSSAMTAGGRVEPRYRMIGGMGLEPLNSRNGATRVANVQTAATAIMAIA